MIHQRSLLRAVILAWAVLLALPVGLRTATAAEGNWKAGVARAIITPETPMWMSGYAARSKPADGKLHDLWAKALALVDPQGRRAVMVTLDLCGIDRQFAAEVCSALAQEHQLDRSHIALCISHTHSGPVVERNLAPMYFLDEQQRQRVHDYTEKLRRQVISIAGEALAAAQPAEIAFGEARAAFAVNRRNNPEAEVPRLREEGKLRGPVDHDVPVLAVKNAKHELIAIVFGYACHATTLDGYQWSGDYPGETQIALEKRHPGATAMFVAGCGADQNPIPRRKVELSVAYGKQLAEAVDEVLSKPMQPIHGAFASQYHEIDLPFAHVPDHQELEQQRNSSDKYVASRARLLLEKIDAGQPLSKTYPYPVQTWRLGDTVRMVLLGGEVVVDYSLRLKDELPRKGLWPIGYSNDVMAYIPSRRVLQEGGYEGGGAMVYYGLPSPWGEEVEKLIVDEVKRQAAR